MLLFVFEIYRICYCFFYRVCACEICSLLTGNNNPSLKFGARTNDVQIEIVWHERNLNVESKITRKWISKVFIDSKISNQTFCNWALKSSQVAKFKKSRKGKVWLISTLLEVCNLLYLGFNYVFLSILF